MTRPAILGGFAALGLVAVVIEVAARRGVGRLATLGTVTDALLARPCIRLAVLVAWLWVGWHLFVR